MKNVQDSMGNRIKVGDQVKITSYRFAGETGTVVEITKAGLLVVETGGRVKRRVAPMLVLKQ